MDADAPRGLCDYFDSLQDPRMQRTRLHRLDDILALAILATIAGAEGWTEIEQFGREKFDWLSTILHLPHGIPSHDTIGRLFAALDSEAFERCFLAWVEGLMQTAEQPALHIDGKTLRHSFDTASSKAAIHMVSVWASKCELVLGQIATDAKSNEITAIPRLLDLITLHGAVVTIDAMGCQKNIAQKIITGGGDYILSLKENQPTLREDVKLLLDEAVSKDFEGMGYDFHETIEKGHGRIETRRVWVTREVDWLRQRSEWANLRGVIRVESIREKIDPAGGPPKRSIEQRDYITSLDHRKPRHCAARLGELIRSHWGIENKLHWSLDVSFGEDACRVRMGQAAENLSRLRRIALNLLKQEKTAKVGIAAKRKKAGWSNRYLLKVMGREI